MSARSITTVPERLAERARAQPDAPAYGARDASSGWQVAGWGAYHERARRVARALIALGVEPGDRVGILAGNRAEWALTALGTLTCGGVMAGVYQTCSAEQVAYVVGDAGCRVLVVEDRDQLAKLDGDARARLPALAAVVLMTDGAGGTGRTGDRSGGALAWDDFLAAGDGDGVGEAAVDARLEALEAGDLASLIYTSGTTGEPKGVMLSHGNLAETASLLDDLFAFSPHDRLVSYLPLAHIAEQNLSIHLAVWAGYAVYFEPEPSRLMETLKAVLPTIFFGVPRVWERFDAGIRERLAAATGARKALAGWALRVGAWAASRRRAGAGTGLMAAVADRLVLAKVRAALGFGRLRLAASGAAPIQRDAIERFGALGIDICEVYGLSETSGPATWNRPGRTRLGTVGEALPRVAVRLADDGEVMVRGPNVFGGYYGDPERSAEALRDGWLMTGDLGVLDADGYLTITGRKKEILITSGGKNIAPAALEAALKGIELVADAVVLGDGRRFLTALLSLEPEAAARFAAARGLDVATLADDPALRATLETEVSVANARFARVEQVRDFRVLPRPLSIDEGELTPTLKVRRPQVEARWASLIEDMYAP